MIYLYKHIVTTFIWKLKDFVIANILKKNVVCLNISYMLIDYELVGKLLFANYN